MKIPQTTYLGLGSNLGDRSENLRNAVGEIARKVEIQQKSGIYETPPWGVIEQPPFLNQVVQGITFLAPHQLLAFLKDIEKRLGRTPSIRFGPRLIDLDILLYSNRIISSKRLQVPHPAMLYRAFVLVPLAEIAPDLVIPLTARPVKDFLASMDTAGITRLY